MDSYKILMNATDVLTEDGDEVFSVTHGGVECDMHFSESDSSWYYVDDHRHTNDHEEGDDMLPTHVYMNDRALSTAHKYLGQSVLCTEYGEYIIDGVGAVKVSGPIKYDEPDNPKPKPGTLVFDDDHKHTNEAGGTQTKLPVRCDLLPADVLLRISAVLAEGADKYGDNNWKHIETNDHINHALTHIYRWNSGDTSEPHLVHALCRLLFADHIENLREED